MTSVNPLCAGDGCECIHTLTRNTSRTFQCQHLSIPKGAENKVNFLERLEVQRLIYSCLYFGVCIMSFKTSRLKQKGVGDMDKDGAGWSGSEQQPRCQHIKVMVRHEPWPGKRLQPIPTCFFRSLSVSQAYLHPPQCHAHNCTGHVLGVC